METDNIFSDQMQIRRPQLFILFRAVSVRVVSDARDVIAQRIQPDIDHMLVVKVNGNSPFEGRPGHTQILKPGQQKIIHHLVFAGCGLNKFRVLVNMLNQPVRILAHTEKVRLFFGRLHFSAAIGTFSVHQLTLRPEGFAGRTIHPLIRSLIDIALVIKAFENLLHLLFMRFVRGADKFVIGDIQHITHSLNYPGNLIHEFFGRNAGLLGLQLNLLAMLIRSRLEKDVVALLSLKPGDAVRQHNLIVIADMRLAGRIGNGRGQIISSLVLHVFLLLSCSSLLTLLH